VEITIPPTLVKGGYKLVIMTISKYYDIMTISKF